MAITRVRGFSSSLKTHTYISTRQFPSFAYIAINVYCLVLTHIFSLRDYRNPGSDQTAAEYAVEIALFNGEKW